MAKRNRRSFGKLLRGAVKDVVVPTSMGLGLALGGCGGSSDKADVPMWAIMPPADAAADQRDGYAIMPPVKDAASDSREARAEVPIYAIMPLVRDAALDTRDARPDVPIYAIMPLAKDAAQETRDGGPDYRIPYRPENPDLALPDREPDRQETATPDTTKPLPKDTGLIYAIMPLAVLPPRG